MAKSKLQVCLVDHDPASRESFRLAAKDEGFEPVTFTNAQEFLAAFEPKATCCLVISANLPGMSGMELFNILCQRRTPIPTIILVGNADVSVAVEAMKNGAIDCIKKPLKQDVLPDRLRQAFAIWSDWQKIEKERQVISARMALLTPRELEVFHLMADGMKNIAIAKKLGISRKTLDIHRTKVVDKMKARTWADIARWRLLHGSRPGGVVTIKAGSYVS